MIRVAIIGLRGYPANFPGSSGIDTYIEKILPHLSKKISPTLFCRSWSRSTSPQCFNIPCLDSRYFDTIPYSIFATISAIIKRYPVIWFQAPSSCLLLPLAKLFGIYTITTFHGIDWQRKKWSQFYNRFFLQSLEYLAAHYSNQITAVSTEVKKYLETKYYRHCHLTPPGFNPKSTSSAAQNYILYLGRLVPEKRVDWLIKAFKKIPLSNFQLIISGQINNSSYCRHLQKISQNHSNIIFTDYVSGQKKQKLLKHCHLLVLPSELEGNSLALLEALELNKLCLISNLSNHRKLAKKFSNITLFDLNKFSDFHQKLKLLITLPPQQYVSTNKLLTWKQSANKIISLLIPH